jgi:uncharacterized pyridoxamine 5'-phosphate oxidase family protein
MTPEEIAEFINGFPRYGTLATLRRSGSPITDGIGVEWDEGCLWFSVRNTRSMFARLTNDPRISIHVMNQTYPPVWVRMEGTAEPADDPDWSRTLRIMRRYMDPSSPAQTLKTFDMATFEPNYLRAGRTLFRLRPDVIMSHDAHKYGEDAHEQVGGAGASDARAGAE